MKIFVAGATGALGLPLVRALRTLGHQHVGWVERSETHHLYQMQIDGYRFRSTHPTSWTLIC
jgi:nucleoside-diphosphate-sugar epimerase